MKHLLVLFRGDSHREAPQNVSTSLLTKCCLFCWVEQRGTLTIITGPIFAVEGDRLSYKVIGGNHVAVPTHFYKIIVDAKSPDSLEALAFMLPNENLSGHCYSEFLTTIDEIRR